MATQLMYLEDFGVVACDAAVVEIKDAEDGRTVIILDRTCFYPRGGGQDWDTGSIRSDVALFNISEVRLDELGVVQHIGSFESGTFEPGDSVQCRVDEARRNTNTRLHSAGHVIDMALSEVAPDWIPGRGGHYPHMSFVEYAVPDGTVVAEGLVQTIQDTVDGLLGSAYQNKLMFVSKDQMPKYCRHVPENVPSNKPSRIVLYADDFGIPCGGTHVRQTADIGQVTVTKIKVKQGLAKVSYVVAGIN